MKKFLLFIATATAIAANAQVYKDRTASPRERAESIVKEITLAPEQFEWFDYETSRMKPLPGEYIVSYGPSSDPACLKSITVNR